MLASLDPTRLCRATIVGLVAGVVGLGLALAGLGWWGFVIALALSAAFVGFVVDLRPPEQPATPAAADAQEVARPRPPAVERQELAPAGSRAAEIRARAAEWLTEYLHECGPTPRDVLHIAAAKEGITREVLARAITDMGVVVDTSDPAVPLLHLPQGVEDLLEAGADERLTETREGFVKARTLSVGESLVGEGNEVAHVDVVIGSKSGPVGRAFAGALVNQSEGHTNLLAIVAPNLPAKPDTIIANKVTIKDATQAVQMFGPAQAAVARGVLDSVREGVIPQDEVDDLCIICGVFIHWEATDDKKIFDCNYQATKEAIARALNSEPTVSTILDSEAAARHPFAPSAG
jgi:5,6,7,8-tetrahydromethanopterin hydro-lyase